MMLSGMIGRSTDRWIPAIVVSNAELCRRDSGEGEIHHDALLAFLRFRTIELRTIATKQYPSWVQQTTISTPSRISERISFQTS
jgi:hypothetical protein